MKASGQNPHIALQHTSQLLWTWCSQVWPMQCENGFKAKNELNTHRRKHLVGSHSNEMIKSKRIKQPPQPYNTNLSTGATKQLPYNTIPCCSRRVIPAVNVAPNVTFSVTDCLLPSFKKHTQLAGQHLRLAFVQNYICMVHHLCKVQYAIANTKLVSSVPSDFILYCGLVQVTSPIDILSWEQL